jgi:hypothetical protein
MEEFWTKYIEADILERLDIIETLWKTVIKKGIEDYGYLEDEEQKDRAIAQFLNSYFEDLVEVMEGKK